jgi:MAM domain.
MEANNKKGRYPTAHLVSPMYYNGAYDCWFSFYYNMWHASSTNTHSDLKLNVYYRKYGRDTLLGENQQSTGNQWQQFHVKLPSCPKDFNVSIL